MDTIALLFLTVSQSLNLPPGLLSAICKVESNHVVSAINLRDRGSPSIGFCQLKLSTSRLVGFKGDAKLLQTDASTNIYYAGVYLSRQLRRYAKDTRCAIAAYNAGTCRHNDSGQIKNRLYVDKVMNVWRKHEDTDCKAISGKCKYKRGDLQDIIRQEP